MYGVALMLPGVLCIDEERGQPFYTGSESLTPNSY
jgi:hypothetical protein